MRIVLDTNFFISATQWDTSVAHKLLRKLIETNSEVFTTKEILEEFFEVLERDFRYKKEEINNLIEKLLSFVKIVEPKEKINIVIEDADDNKIIECAVESRASYILSYDKHLLNLKEYRGIKIIRPEELIGFFK